LEFENVILKCKDEIGIITLNRPKQLNAINVQMMNDLLTAYEIIKNDNQIKVMIITGAGDHGFCSGADLLDSTRDGIDSDSIIRAAKCSDLDPVGTHTLRIREMDKPTIAAVNGIAVGAGFSIALACDIRLASEKAEFGAVFIGRSLMCNEGATYYLPEIVGPSKALELMYSGEAIDAWEAQRIGLVNRVVSPDDLMKEAKGLAKRIAAAPSLVLAFTKRAIYQSARNNLKSQLIYEAYAWNTLLGTEDFKEGIKSFLEKREPHFKGNREKN
jgi:2-(1,2-epoxy-1,2-dihydrophenyl)acetyl-CoA isomerase